MDDKVNYTLVGGFVLVLGAALVAAVLWLSAGIGGQKHYLPYQSVIEESVAGLDVGAPVKYLGVDVGKVREIRLDPKNPDHVLLQLLIERGTPIRRDTVAVLKTQGLTGIAYVELSGGSAASAPRLATDDDPVPTIPSKPSLSTRLENVFTTVLASLERTSGSLNALLDDGNRAALKKILADTAELTQALAAQKGALTAGIANAARTAANTARASEQLTPVIAQISGSAAAVEKMADEAARAAASAGRTVDTIGSSAQQINSETLPELQRLLAEMNTLAASLRRLTEQTERDPSSLLLGKRSLTPGPGEKAPP